MTDLQTQIKESIRSSSNYDPTSVGQVISIERLCNLNMHIPRQEILSALIDMEGVEVLDSETGTLQIPMS